MVLTEFLYQKDEVVASFLLSMVFATDINEAVFFISELYNSGFYDDVYNVIWSLYFDFYYVTNNKLVSYINETILRDLKEKNIQNIHNIVKTLYPKNKCIPVFLLNQNTKIYGENQKITVFRGKKPTFLSNFNPVSHGIIRSLEKFNWKNITYYLASASEEELSTIYSDVEKYLISKKKKVTLDFTTSYQNKKHLLMSLIAVNYCLEKEEVIVYTDKMYNYIPPKYDNNIPRKILKDNKHYAINKYTSAFILERDDVDHDTFIEKLFNNWEDECKDTPIWRDRFEEYNVTFKNGKVIFPNEDVLEEFYEKYGFEPDEQLEETTNKSHRELEVIASKTFLSEILEELEFSSVDIPETMIDFFAEFQNTIQQKYVLL